MIPVSSGKKMFAYGAAVLLPVLLLMALRVLVLCVDGETDLDSYYHAAIAERGPGMFTARQFPQTTMSIWHEQFSDKELGFHFRCRL